MKLQPVLDRVSNAKMSLPSLAEMKPTAQHHSQLEVN